MCACACAFIFLFFYTLTLGYDQWWVAAYDHQKQYTDKGRGWLLHVCPPHLRHSLSADFFTKPRHGRSLSLREIAASKTQATVRSTTHYSNLPAGRKQISAMKHTTALTVDRTLYRVQNAKMQTALNGDVTVVCGFL